MSLLTGYGGDQDAAQRAWKDFDADCDEARALAASTEQLAALKAK